MHRALAIPAAVLGCLLSWGVAFGQEDLPLATPVKPADSVPVAKPSARPLSATIELTRGNPLQGTLTDTTELQMKTTFGAISIPLGEVAGVRFATAEEATTTVVMLNGDSVTGATNVERITAETEWGVAQVNGSAIASILLVPDLQWTSYDGLTGKRWSLVERTATGNASSNTPPSSRPFSNQGSSMLPSGGTIIRN